MKRELMGIYTGIVAIILIAFISGGIREFEGVMIFYVFGYLTDEIIRLVNNSNYWF